MEFKTIICQNENCGKEVIIKKNDFKTMYCPECNKQYKKEYHRIYNKNYKAIGNHKRENRRHYTRTKLKNISKQFDINEYTEYCKNNWSTVEGCLNCICPECIQPDKSDDFLPWENEGFYEDDKKIDYTVERSIG